jgi:MoxR-like ATPase
MNLQPRMEKLISAVSDGMYEREEIIAVALLGALCGQNTFLYGPPGTAKSLISRRIACAFAKPAYFEYLMNRFSTPEDVFGPVSIKALKEDQYLRKTQNYLPKAEFAFLDEIWKSSPAILNTLLTLINERIFRNGESIEPAPLKALIAASNETPEANQGLDALYDRFIVRLMAGPIEQTANFDRLLSSRPTAAEVAIPADLVVSPDEWSHWQEQLHTVQLSVETVTIIHLIREALTARYAELQVYVSDRRWQRAAILMKAAAFFNGRSETNHSDALLLRHCLWTQEQNREAVCAIVEQAVKETGFDSGINLAQIDSEKEALENEINKELFYSADIYKTEKVNGKDVFTFNGVFDERSYNPRKVNLLIPVGKIKKKGEFHPLDLSGNELEYITCEFDGQGVCNISHDHSHSTLDFKPTLLFHKGDKKTDVNERLITSLAKSVSDIREKLLKILNKVESQHQGYETKLASLFVPTDQSAIAIQGITEQIERLKMRIKDCERLEALCQ